LLAFTSAYFSESGLFNGLQRKTIKNLPLSALAFEVARLTTPGAHAPVFLVSAWRERDRIPIMGTCIVEISVFVKIFATGLDRDGLPSTAPGAAPMTGITRAHALASNRHPGLSDSVRADPPRPLSAKNRLPLFRGAL